ncbi:MAG: CBS domain-containing protein [Bdellovibrionota bacterium]
MDSHQFGVVDNRFLARSLGTLNPHSPILVPQETKLSDAIELLQKHKIGCVIVTDVIGKIQGIFTERDVLLKVALKPIHPSKVSVASVMTKNPQTATMTTSVAFSLNMMSHGGYRHLPIVDDENYPIGIISVKDIVDYLSHAVTKDLAAFGMEE